MMQQEKKWLGTSELSDNRSVQLYYHANLLTICRLAIHQKVASGKKGIVKSRRTYPLSGGASRSPTGAKDSKLTLLHLRRVPSLQSASSSVLSNFILDLLSHFRGGV